MAHLERLWYWRKKFVVMDDLFRMGINMIYFQFTTLPDGRTECKVVDTLKGHSQNYRVTCIEKGKFEDCAWSAGSDLTICQWNTAELRLLCSISNLESVTKIFYFDRIIWLGTNEGKIMLFTKNLKEIPTPRSFTKNSHASRITGFLPIDEKTVITSATDQTLKIWRHYEEV